MAKQKSDRHEFQAEVKQLLDIVVHSLYTDKEIFIRELVSNASDALEKLRYIQQTEKGIFDEKLPLEIEIKTSEKDNTITITDFGVGMTRDELVENLGTIAHSGSKRFLESIKEERSVNENLIGQFGVGFYSSFMVAKSVEVYTRSWKSKGEHLLWKSDGSGTFEVEKVKGNRRGTKVVILLKDEYKEFSDTHRVKDVLNRYSGFVQFPIKLDGEQINKIEAIWLRSKSDIKEDEYKEFYKFQSNAFDDPNYTLHFSSDAPIEINALLFVPTENPEIPGLGRVDPGVSIYCKRVMIDSSPKYFLPEWLRFLKGVVDSADLPLNISRESMQDSSLMDRLGKAITKRFIRFLSDESKKDKKKYSEFYNKFGFFIKEGASSDFLNREQLQKLLMFETSATDKGELKSLEDYVSGMKDDQKEIYYAFGNDRGLIDGSPQMEVVKDRGLEAIYIYEPIDDFVINGINEFDGRKVVSVDTADLDFKTSRDKKSLIPEDEAKDLCGWIKDTLGDEVEEVKVSTRLIDSPVVALNTDKMMTHSMRRFANFMDKSKKTDYKVRLEINDSHKLIKNLNLLRQRDEPLAKTVVEQIYDNSLLMAGLIDEPQNMVGRIYSILEHVSAE